MKKVISLLLLALVVLAGCSSAKPPLNTDDIGVSLDTNSEMCMTVDGYKADMAKSFAAGQLAGCKADIVLNNPTYAQLQQFLKDNQTLTKCEGNCVQRTEDLSNCAVANGWEMYVVLLNFKETGTGHVLGAFQTKDKGMVFVEAQTLWIVKVELGYDYAQNFLSHNWSFGVKDGVQGTFTIKQIGIFR